MADESRFEGGKKVSQKPIWGKNFPGQGKSLVVERIKMHLFKKINICGSINHWEVRDESSMFLASKKLINWYAAAAKSLQSCPTLCNPIDGSPPGFPRPWDSPGKNTGVGCHFLLQCMKVKSESEVTQSCPTQRPHGLQPTRLLHPWDFPGKTTGVGCHCLLQ